MPHFNRLGGTKLVRRVEPQWLELNGQIGRLVNDWASRRDLAAYIGKDGGRGYAPALFDPISLEIEVNTTIAFGENVEPWAIGDFTDRDVQFEWMAAAGAIMHEAGHARYTTLAMCTSHEVLDVGPNHWFTIMDESRIEGMILRALPENREFLRACALGIVLGDSDQRELAGYGQTKAAAHLALLSLARVDVGVLEKSDVKKIRRQIKAILPVELLQKLREIWREYQTCTEVHINRMYELAKEFDKLVEEQAKNDPQQEDDDLPQWLKDLLDSLIGDKASAEFGAAQNGFEQRQKERIEIRNKARQQAENDRIANEAAAKRVFEDSSRMTPDGTILGQRVGSREPTDAERAAATTISRKLKRARYRDRLSTNHSNEIPPGRLDVGTAMQGKAMRANGGKGRNEPYRERRYKNVEDPTIVVGLMCDKSGSMGWAMEPVAASTWILSAALKRIHGTLAGLLFGSSITPIIHPGEHHKTVNIWSNLEGVEDFDRGFRALDGALNLLDGSGPRLLVVCSDGQYGGTTQDGGMQLDACINWLKKCRAAGVGVIWLDYKDSGRVQSICEQTGATQVVVSGAVTDAADAIGQAAADALTKAGR